MIISNIYIIALWMYDKNVFEFFNAHSKMRYIK